MPYTANVDDTTFVAERDTFSNNYVALTARSGAPVFLPRSLHEFIGSPEFQVGSQALWTARRWPADALDYVRQAVLASLDLQGSRARFKVSVRKLDGCDCATVTRVAGERSLPRALLAERKAARALLRTAETDAEVIAAIAAQDAYRDKARPGVPLTYRSSRRR
jgi:hypothetical protein